MDSYITLDVRKKFSCMYFAKGNKNFLVLETIKIGRRGLSS